ncbi:hypothetical protein HY768_10385 [candidate division TA06 bacterium]|uniref:Uncharacterized protein n=1 Tax=candidate division TA06 bacterium TaxID=2250710 RepID=A0A933IC66_UNCT6|nr:hypothetical protein [candidate division TA06 bacterium]
MGIGFAYLRKGPLCEKSIHIHGGIQALQTAPDTHGARHAIALTPQMSADAAEHPDRLCLSALVAKITIAKFFGFFIFCLA